MLTVHQVRLAAENRLTFSKPSIEERIDVTIREMLKTTKQIRLEISEKDHNLEDGYAALNNLLEHGFIASLERKPFSDKYTIYVSWA